jgi:hypothetical protein
MGQGWWRTHPDTAPVWSPAFTRLPGTRQPGPSEGGTPNGSRLGVAPRAVSRCAPLVQAKTIKNVVSECDILVGQCLTYGHRVAMIDIQNKDGCSTNGCFSAQPYPFPGKMIVPTIDARMKKSRHFAVDRVKAAEVGPFAQIAGKTGPSQIVFHSCSAVLFRDNVVAMKCQFGRRFGNMAIFATCGGATNHPLF